jgi:hypothetical protein
MHIAVRCAGRSFAGPARGRLTFTGAKEKKNKAMADGDGVGDFERWLHVCAGFSMQTSRELSACG